MNQFIYWYPPTKADGPGHIHRHWQPWWALCSEVLPRSQGHQKTPKPGWKICDTCKAERDKIRPNVDLDWAQIDPQSEDFMALSPEHKMVVLAARQAAREQGR